MEIKTGTFETLCFVCGSNHWQSYFSSKEFPRYTYSRCQKCSFIQLLPLPSQHELDQFYNHLWSKNKKSDAYIDRFLSRDIPDSKSLIEWYGAEFSQWKNFLPASAEKCSLLDVGVGRGNILAAAGILGWNASGMDISGIAAESLSKKHNFKVIQGDFCTFPVENLEKVNAIHMNHVLEHMRDPNLAIEQIKKILKPGGLFCFAVPCIDRRLFNLTSKIWKWLYEISGKWNGFHPFFWCFFSIGHISCFSSDTINSFLTKHGFEVKWQKQTLPSPLRTGSWLRYFRSIAISPLFWLTRSGWEIRIVAQLKGTR